MIRDETGKPMEARKVFGAGIKYLKEHFLKKMKRQLPLILEEDIMFVLTVPAILNKGAKQFMMEAAKEVCINHINFVIVMRYRPKRCQFTSRFVS